MSFLGTVRRAKTYLEGDVFLRDRQEGTTERVSVATDGTEANNGSLRAFVSNDGRAIVFDADATNLVASDGNNVADVFLRLRLPDPAPPKTPSLTAPGLLALTAALLVAVGWRLAGGRRGGGTSDRGRRPASPASPRPTRSRLPGSGTAVLEASTRRLSKAP